MSIRPTSDQILRAEERKRRDELLFKQLVSDKEQSQRYDGLKSVARDSHAVLRKALPYVNNDDIKAEMESVMSRLVIWDAAS